MKIENRGFEIELIPETEFEKDVLARLHEHREIKIKDGKTSDRNYPSDRRKTNIVLCLPDPNDWGR